MDLFKFAKENLCNEPPSFRYYVDHNAICDYCDKAIINGPRYKCSICEDFDSCSACIAGVSTEKSRLLHPETHTFLKLNFAIPLPVETRHPMQLPMLYPIGIPMVMYSSNVVVHKGVICDNCRMPIVGTRWLCVNCKCDICSECENMHLKGFVHDINHVFLRILFPIPPIDSRPQIHLSILYHSKLTQIRVFHRTPSETHISSDQKPSPLKQTSPVIFREMLPSDINAVHVIECQAFSSPYEKNYFRALLKTPNVQIFVTILQNYRDNKSVVAYIAWSFETVEEMRILSLAVDKYQTGKGIGKLLMEFAIQRALQHNLKIITLHVSSENRVALSLYNKLQFKPIYWLDQYYSKKEDGILMQLNLQPSSDPVSEMTDK